MINEKNKTTTFEDNDVDNFFSVKHRYSVFILEKIKKKDIVIFFDMFTMMSEKMKLINYDL